MTPYTFQQVLEAQQQAVINAASTKLNRSLTEDEVNGIKNVHSPMLLEAYEQEFDWRETTSEQILKSLEYLAAQKTPFKL